ncbi:hypothetical protein L1987_13619 [Smallanthus sonchifolius]|uniref:Uncharacterized protein n=1 Tax=Smallanthus sonchifolius TaxID=185202 RepID=A0ACB9JJP4_9ASTR|nr:hypothetical protein L1987_13619 [Smallanthus sonchifolius]
MSVVGFDLGNESRVVAVARQRGIDVVLNDESKRETPALVCFGDKHRFLGTTGAASAYGIYKTDLPENEQLNVAFVDIGHASMQVCIAGFKKGQLKVLAHSFDRFLGGRDFDEVLFQHFAEKFKTEYKIDVFQNAIACLRLRAACEKLKKVLSVNPEAPMNIECLLDDKDVRGSRVPAVIKILTEFFGKEPRRTMNASECVSKGCASECAILSPTFKVREFQVQESFPFSIALTWKGSAQDYQNGNVENQQSNIIFPNGNQIPSMKALTFYRTGTFTVDVQYADLIEEEEVEVPVSKEPSKMDIDKAPADVASTIETDVNMQDAPVTENGAQGMGDNPVQMEADAKDRVMEETKDKKNAVEAYVYDMRNKLHDKLHEFVTEPEREAFIAKLQETEDWLYEDGEDETKGVYISKLDELKKQGDPIEQRYKEHLERGSFVDKMLNHINVYRQAATSGDPKYEHIDLSEKQKVLIECSEAENWLREAKQLQDSLPKHVDPVFLSSDIRKKAETLDRVCRPIMTKPKPAPPKPSAPEKPSSPAPTQEGEQQPSQEENATSPNPSAENNENSDEPAAMETKKPEAAA